MCNNCYFCKENRFTLNKELGLETENSVIYEDNNVFITPDIAPVVNGHYLIITHEHINSYGNADYSVYTSLKVAQEYLMNSVYHDNNVLFWEHGAVVCNSAGRSIDHAHIHAIPMIAELQIDEYLDSLKLFMDAPRKIMNYESLRKTASSGQSYISYAYGNGEEYYRCVNWLPSQFFRIMISKYYPQEFDWRKRCREQKSKEMFESTLKFIR